jgi:hypothetical protein
MDNYEVLPIERRTQITACQIGGANVQGIIAYDGAPLSW